MFPHALPQQFISASSGRNPWATSNNTYQQTKPNNVLSKTKLPPTVAKTEFVLKETKTSAAAPVVSKQKPKAPPEASPDEFIQLGNARGGRWNVPTVTDKPVSAVQLPKKKQNVIPTPVSVQTPAPVSVQIPTPSPPQQQPLQVPASATPAPLEDEINAQNLYKTELCRSFEETGNCRYGTKCQFAHGRAELRPVLRHPKYKTEVCKTFHTIGTCPYGKRCRFIHSTIEVPAASAPATPAPVATTPVTPVAPLPVQQTLPPQLPVLIDTKEWSTSWNVPQKDTSSQLQLQETKPSQPAFLPVTTQKPSMPVVFPVQETKPVTCENFLPSFPAHDIVELPQKIPIMEETIIAAVTEEPVFPAVVPVVDASPAPAVAAPSSETEEEDEDDEAGGRRLSIFAQICSNEE